MEQEESFEIRLYEAMRQVHPSITTRLFSVACLNRSASYWSSVLAQKLKVPNNALLSLHDYLEAHKIVHSNKHLKVQVITGIQTMIEDEIISRFRATNQVSEEGWKRLSQSIRDEEFDEKYGYMDYIPFRWSKY